MSELYIIRVVQYIDIVRRAVYIYIYIPNTHIIIFTTSDLSKYPHTYIACLFGKLLTFSMRDRLCLSEASASVDVQQGRTGSLLHPCTVYVYIDRIINTRDPVRWVYNIYNNLIKIFWGFSSEILKPANNLSGRIYMDRQRMCIIFIRDVSRYTLYALCTR